MLKNKIVSPVTDKVCNGRGLEILREFGENISLDKENIDETVDDRIYFHFKDFLEKIRVKGGTLIGKEKTNKVMEATFTLLEAYRMSSKQTPSEVSVFLALFLLILIKTPWKMGDLFRLMTELDEQDSSPNDIQKDLQKMEEYMQKLMNLK